MPRRKKSSLGSVSSAAKRMRLSRSAESERSRPAHTDSDNVQPGPSHVDQVANPSAPPRRGRSVSNRRNSSESIGQGRSRQHSRELESPTRREIRLSRDRERHAQARLHESPGARQARLQYASDYKAQVLENETPEARQARLQYASDYQAHVLENESEEQRAVRLHRKSLNQAQVRENESPEARQARLEYLSNHQAQVLEHEPEEQRAVRLHRKSLNQAQVRENESPEARQARLEYLSNHQAQVLEHESEEQRAVRLHKKSLNQAQVLENESPEARQARLQYASDYQTQVLEHESEEQRAIRLHRKSLNQAQVLENESPEARQARLQYARDYQTQVLENESPEARQARLQYARDYQTQVLENESPEARQARLAYARDYQTQVLENESPEARQARLAYARDYQTQVLENESDEQKEVRLELAREYQTQVRQRLTDDEIEARRLRDREMYDVDVSLHNMSLEEEVERVGDIRDNEENEERVSRLAADSQRHTVMRELEDEPERRERRGTERARHVTRSLGRWRDRANSGFTYNPLINYAEASNIGLMDYVCSHCNALTWKGESKGICCSAGKVVLPPIIEAPEPLRSLLNGDHPKSRDFLANIRAYNCAFQMTSFGAHEVAEHGFMPTFRIQGQVYHLIGSLLPPVNQPASFLQIYFISEADVQTAARHSNFDTLDAHLIELLQNMLHEENSYVRSFKTTLETSPPESDIDNYQLVIRADRRPTGEHAGRYNAPSVNEVAVLMVGEPSDRRDIIVRARTDRLSRVCETHRSYDALQYPLMFSRGEDGYNFLIFHVDPTTGLHTNKKTSACEFYAYRIMVRPPPYSNNLHQYRQLFNQFLVDMYAKIESERLLYIRTNQNRLRAENYIHLQDAIRRDVDPEQLGQVVILPSSFTGGPRYMHARTQDAFCYVRKFGRPDLFITITTNPKWEEITSSIFPGQTAQDRHDIVARVFHLKLKSLMALQTKGEIYGPVRCFIYSVEWQKRGLPHAHILTWLEERIRPDQIDDVIKAEIPDSEADPELFLIVKSNNIHGPCGAFNTNAPCMKDGRCSKRFPKHFTAETITGEDGYPSYRRRAPESGGFTCVIRVRGGENMTVDNRWVVPYSPVLSRTFKTHINVEICSSVQSIKYMCKYINKGSDQATFAISNEHDEVQRYQSGRYISTSEAVWRILSFPIHERYPAVMHLAVHLENEQRVYFSPDNIRERLENPPNTTLTAFFTLCQNDPFAKTIFYNEVASYYTFDKQRGQFSRRKIGQPVTGYPGVKKDATIGRVYTVHPSSSERFHLRLLLHTVKGPTSFENLKTVDEVVHPTYQAACQALGLLENDSQWEETLSEAVISNSPPMIRELFAVILVFCSPSNAFDLWMRFRDHMAEDCLREARVHDVNVTFDSAPQLYNNCLSRLQVVVSRIGGLALNRYGLPSASDTDIHNAEYSRELAHNNSAILYLENNANSLNDEQNQVHQTILSSINSPDTHNLYFLDAPGGTGKTFLINLILAQVRSEGKIALAVASSGIAATLLPGGRTAHSMFKIPINVETMDIPVCSISRNAPMAKLLRDCALIVWDECTMANKKAIEALDRTLRDIRRIDMPMGGVTVLFSGDFRQTLPVIERGTRADEVNASLKRSVLWPHIQRLSLSQNMRVLIGGEPGSEEFSHLLLRIGNGTMEQNEGLISITPELGTVVPTQEALIQHVFPGIEQLPQIPSLWFCERAILTTTNEQAATINKKILSLFQAEERTYLSINTVMNQDEAVHYPREFLESVSAPGLPIHELKLKVGAPIMLLRNLSAPKLCNGTRLRVLTLHRFVLEAEILTGCGVGERVFIPRIPLIPTNCPFEFKRLQFPVSLCFAMTINKSQGQTLSTAGLELSESQCFSHGQLYVACSRVRSPVNLFFHCPNSRTTNVVYTEALQ